MFITSSIYELYEFKTDLHFKGLCKNGSLNFFLLLYAVGKPVKMTDIDNFTTTHYHIKEEYAVDKAKPVEQVDLLLFFIEHDAINYRCFFVQFFRQCFFYP